MDLNNLRGLMEAYQTMPHIEEEKKKMPYVKMFRKAGNLGRDGSPEAMERSKKITGVMNKNAERVAAHRERDDAAKTAKKMKEEVSVDEKYQGMYQSPAPTHSRLKSSDEKARMSPGRRAMAKADELERSEPGSKRAKAQKKASMQMARNFKSARDTKEEVNVDEKFSMAADPSKPEAPRPTRKAANKKSMSMKSRAVKAIGTQRRQDIETGITKESLEATGLFSEAEISRILDIVED
jgi:hypothetical protein